MLRRKVYHVQVGTFRILTSDIFLFQELVGVEMFEVMFQIIIKEFV